MLGKGKSIGIGIGVIFLAFVAYNMFSQGILLPQVDDAHLASLEASYFEDSDRLVVALILTNKDAEYTKANGHLELKVLKGAVRVYSNEYDFTKDDFFSWKTNFGEKITGYRIDINEKFFSGEHDVYVDMVLKSGSSWEGLHASFYSLE